MTDGENSAERIEYSKKQCDNAYGGEAVSRPTNSLDSRLMCGVKPCTDTIRPTLYFYTDSE